MGYTLLVGYMWVTGECLKALATVHTQVQKDADALWRTLREQPTSIADIDPYAGTGQCPRVGSKAELSVWCLGAGAELSREPI